MFFCSTDMKCIQLGFVVIRDTSQNDFDSETWSLSRGCGDLMAQLVHANYQVLNLQSFYENK